MKKKINMYMIAVAIIAVLATAVLILSVFDGIIDRQINKDLKNLSDVIVSSEDDYRDFNFGGTRVTVTDVGGGIQPGSYIRNGSKRRILFRAKGKRRKGILLFARP